MDTIVSVVNTLSVEQKADMSNKLEQLMGKYSKMARKASTETSEYYFQGVTDGLNHAHKLINEVKDDYISRD